ncbi:DeoR/GlpR family DNA-binding transcription regulator [Salibacterium halotolerans]|uniref:DeoR family transcriptional regulator, myo-inositol catabolism operon repressor n=1 Tax=Salibacterium halotolerans TaxID=1884432 RepID=A0A1I5X9E4_9BACI|nr:DeoR/GlpR family DNA-binding transcription regulator [Salibacterium halotolerans]SFQ28603.1 DeoR family transcriptional regulator, myo-inositol catabolism operon repressor [Salibacterium halotolerans]
MNINNALDKGDVCIKVRRLNQIEDYLEENHQASLEELKNHFNVSINTIRRDINELAKLDIVKKVYGGVVYNNNTSVTTSYEKRNISHYAEKKKIGQYCTDFIEEYDIIYIDSGTTTHSILDSLPQEIEFTLITNSLEVINKAIAYPNIHLMVIGETYKRSTKSFTGITDDETITKFNINKAFMSATAFSAHNGASNSDFMENRIKKIVCERANEVYLLIDSSKFGKNSLFTYCYLEHISAIITDADIEQGFADYIVNADKTLITV